MQFRKNVSLLIRMSRSVSDSQFAGHLVALQAPSPRPESCRFCGRRAEEWSKRKYASLAGILEETYGSLVLSVDL